MITAVHKYTTMLGVDIDAQHRLQWGNKCHGRFRLRKRNSIFALSVFLNFPLDLIEIKTNEWF